MKLVLAGNYNEYLNFLRENRISRNSREVKYISGASSLCGHLQVTIIKYGTWYTRDKELLSHIEIMEKFYEKER